MIAVVVCVLLLVVLVALLFFLSKNDKLSCGKKDKNNGVSGDENSKKVNEESAPLKSNQNTEQC